MRYLAKRPYVGRRPDGTPIWMDARKARTLRGNLHRVRPGPRIDQVARRREKVGAIHATPGHEGTTKGCPRRHAVRDKTRGERKHDCPTCGLSLPRDQASAIMTVGRALLEFREGSAPGGRVAARRRKAAKAEADGERLKTARLEGGRKAREKKQILQGERPCAPMVGAKRQESSPSPVKGMEFQTDPLLSPSISGFPD
jgi:hypothetical protein